MLKRLVILALFVSVFCIQGVSQSHKTKQKAKGNEPTTTTAPSAPQQSNGLRLQNEYKDHVNADVRVVSTPSKDLYDKAAFWVNLVLAGVGIIGLFAAYHTLRKLERQTKAGEDAAKATLKQVDHLIASERAWVMADLRFELGSGLVWGDDGTELGGRTMATVILSIKNAGPTPAWVYEQFIHLEVSPEVLTSLEKYESPNFPFIGQGKTSHVNYEIHPLTQDDDPIGWKAWVFDEGISTSENGLHVYIYGVVRYRDAFNSKRETYFGYSVKGNNRLERIPNEAYNKHT